MVQLEYNNKALETDLRNYGPDHPDVAIDWSNLGLAWESLGESTKALGYYKKAYLVFLEKLGKDHKNTKLAGKNIAGLKN